MSKVKIVWFRDLKLWDLRSNLFINEVFANSKFELVQISSFLHRNKTSIKIQDNQTYKRVTIKTKGQGCFLRDTLQGSFIGTKSQFLIKEGQFLISKIDARYGAFGVVSKEIHNAIITGNFWTYDIDTSKINAHFLALLTARQDFMEFCKACSGGTTGRHYLDESKFLSAKIPLPPLEIQQEIVSQVESIKIQIKALQEEEKRLKDEIERYIYIALGLEKPKELIKHKVFTINFKDLTRWDVRHNQALATPLQKHLSTEQSTQDLKQELKQTLTQDVTQEALQEQAQNLTQEPQEQEQEQALTPPPQGWEMVKLEEVLSYERPDAYIVHSDKYSNEYTTPVLTAGKTFILGYTDEKDNIYKNAPVIIFDDFTTASKFVDFEFKVKSSAMKILKNRNDEISNIKFVFYAMQTIKLNLSLALRRYWISMYKALQIPLPPLEIQEQIVNHVEKKQAKITSLQEKYKALQESLTNYLESCL